MDQMKVAEIREQLCHADVARAMPGHRYIALAEWATNYGISLLDLLDAQAEELAALRRNRAAWEVSGLALETRVRELERLLRRHAALHCDECIGSGLYLGEDDRDGPCELCGGSGVVLPADVSAAINANRPQANNDLPASRGTTSGELLQLHDRAERQPAHARPAAVVAPVADPIDTAKLRDLMWPVNAAANTATILDASRLPVDRLLSYMPLILDRLGAKAERIKELEHAIDTQAEYIKVLENKIHGMVPGYMLNDADKRIDSLLKIIDGMSR